ACIDENLEVVRFLVEQGATVNQADNEGWTPLHVAASCGYLDIARYLLSHGANIAAVNSDGDLPLDLAESDAMEGLLKAEIAHRGVDVEAAKRAEEELLLHDTRCWLNGGAMPEARHPRTGASALHVAAAKGYIEVMRLLLQAGYDPELRDGDGWTPLHAAAHWGVEDACRLLAEHGGGMDSLTHAGQRPCDLADEEVLSLLEELARKQEDVRAPGEDGPQGRTAPRVWSSTPSPIPRSSVCRLSSREKISLQDLSKERRPSGAGGPPIRDEDEGDEAGGSGVCHGPPGVREGSFSITQTSFAQPPEETPFSRRFHLQKTGSSGALGPPERRGAEAAPGAGLQRSASSSQLEGTTAQATEPRLARIPLTPSRKVPEPSPLGKVHCPGAPGSAGSGGSEGHQVPGLVGKSSILDGDSSKERSLRSYQMPVRDEESESQRKARSRLMRQSRRSTQGVTLTDLKEAEKAAGRAPEPEQSPLPGLVSRVGQLKVELERATQRQERFAERPALLELERFERRALERKAAELEEELKALSDLRADNQRLKDENAALIRVISKLSK
uniref:Protein phosphatase 1 regulatory subunit 12C n=1 Tax=Ictidomys tridecemlineatus TaxID=43179 RepID=I3MC48_ICTTR